MKLEHITSRAAVKGMVRRVNAWKVVSDFASLPSFCRNIDKVLITGKTDAERVSEWDVTFDGAPLNWIQKDILDQNGFAINFRAISGDFEQFSGFLRIEDKLEGGMEVVYSTSYTVGIPIIEELFGPVFRNKMQLNFNAMMTGISGEISKVAIPEDERKERRHKIGVSEMLIFDGDPIEAKIENLSFGGMLFTSQKPFEKPISVKFCGLDISVLELFYEPFDKKYRLVFEKAASEEQLLAAVKKLQSRHVRTMGNLLVMEPAKHAYF